MRCPICGRPLGNVNIDQHHLIPKTFKGKEVITLHKICHKQIHALWSERELLHIYNTVYKIINDERMLPFIKWIQDKPIDFDIKTKDSTIRKSKRRK